MYKKENIIKRGVKKKRRDTRKRKKGKKRH